MELWLNLHKESLFTFCRAIEKRYFTLFRRQKGLIWKPLLYRHASPFTGLSASDRPINILWNNNRQLSATGISYIALHHHHVTTGARSYWVICPGKIGVIRDLLCDFPTSRKSFVNRWGCVILWQFEAVVSHFSASQLSGVLHKNIPLTRVIHLNRCARPKRG